MSDFERNVWCLLGIPVDVLRFDQAVELLETSARLRNPCFFSTPNLNFIVEAYKNKDFKDSVMQSDLVVLDGTPPVWLARLLGAEAIEKVSGSDLVEYFWTHEPAEGGKLRVFLFGGEAGVAEAACSRINTTSSGLECAGFYNPGFGSVDEMSQPGVMNQINDSGADFVLVSLGARKGQAWILANRERLKAPLVSHLGAVVNFAANRVARAPRWMQAFGLEWLWRIGQEPGLWRRYFFDGLYFSWHLLPGVLRYRVWRLLHRQQLISTSPAKARVEYGQNGVVIVVEGICIVDTIDELRAVFRRAVSKTSDIKLDLVGVTLIDGAFLGICLMLHKNTAMREGSLSISGASSTVRRIFRWNNVEWLL